jgi:FAD/FMN-containing dehydrogenase
MSEAIFERLRPIVGAEATRKATGGAVRVIPPSTDAVAGVIGVAHDHGWRVLLEGAATWRTDEPPADIILSLRGLDEMDHASAQPGTVNIGAGVTVDQLRREVQQRGSWMALDSPGRGDRTIGSVLATGTGGPLSHGFGHLTRLVEALTVVTGEGRVLRSTDLETDPNAMTRLHIGSFGALGAVTECRIRSQPLSHSDTTCIMEGDRDLLTALAREAEQRSIPAAAIEIFSPALAARGNWLLAARQLDCAPHELVNALQWQEGKADWQILDTPSAQILWSGTARAVTSVPVSIRLAVPVEGIDETLDLLTTRLGEGMISSAPQVGRVRWSGVADAGRLIELRTELATREVPLTLERAPWRVRRAMGHWGLFRENHRGITSQYQELFDPGHIFVTAIQAGESY